MVNLGSITFSLDDSNGTGSVSPPASIDIGLEGGPLTNYIVPDPAGDAPFQFTVSSLGLTGSSFDVRLNAGNEWIMASEIAFAGPSTAVPEPASLLLIGLGALGLARSRRRRS